MKHVALTIGDRQDRSVRSGPAWPGGDRDERQRRRCVCDRAARTLSAVGWRARSGVNSASVAKASELVAGSGTREGTR